jgi:ribosomal protein S12 methylthiotransferase
MGCSKNLVDSEHLAARCAAAGYDIVFDSNSPGARVVVINTCGFIGDAKEESIEMILDFAAARSRGEIDRLYVIGCLSERYADELREELPEVDSFFGARGLDDILDELVGLKPSGEEEANVPSVKTDGNKEGTRVLSTPPHYAYLKISEGCDRRCGFCAIPLIRGPHVSVPMERLIAEAEELASQGVKELIVIAQDTTYYGLDLYGERRLGELLRRLARVEGIEWIRLHYAYPAGFPEDVIEAMREEPKICKYIDIPLQHISDSQLRAMKRGLGSEGTRRLVRKLREAIPGLAIRTTMLVGYPGETEADFEELMAFVREARFERLGVFPYSEEEGTYSAENLTDDVPLEVKQQRVERLMELQAGISASLNAARVGTTLRVIVDRREGEGWVCRSQSDSPEVDGEILLAATDTELSPGDFVTVKITGADEYDLTAEKIL